jgi:acetyl esterase/lipase
MPSSQSEALRALVKSQVAPLFAARTPLEKQRVIWESLSAINDLSALIFLGNLLKRSPAFGTLLNFLTARPTLAKLQALLAARPRPNRQIEYIKAENIKGEWVTTSESVPGQILYYLHGGGYFLGSARTYRNFVTALAKATHREALALDYRLAPEHPFPAALEDTIAGYRWLVNTRQIKPEQIVIGGDSAGGGLTLATLIALREAGEPLPAAAVLLSPWTDHTFSGASFNNQAKVDPILTQEGLQLHSQRYRGEANPTTPLISPLYADLQGLPPLLIQVGSEELLLDDATRLAGRAKEAGVSVELQVGEGLWHVWQFFVAQMPEAQQAVANISKFVTQNTSLQSGLQ